MALARFERVRRPRPVPDPARHARVRNNVVIQRPARHRTRHDRLRPRRVRIERALEELVQPNKHGRDVVHNIEVEHGRLRIFEV